MDLRHTKKINKMKLTNQQYLYTITRWNFLNASEKETKKTIERDSTTTIRRLGLQTPIIQGHGQTS